MNKFKIKKGTVYAIYWQDAAFSYKKRLPAKTPSSQITFGVIISKNKEFVNVGMNCSYDSDKKKIIVTEDSFIIPKKAIKKIQELGNIHGK